MSLDGSVCFFVLYHYETNSILATPITNLDDKSIFEAYKANFEMLEAKEYKPKVNVMDNQKGCHLQLVEPTTTMQMQLSEPSKHSRTHSLLR